MSLGALLSVVLPVFGFIGLGYAVVAVRLIKQETGDALATFVFTIAVPILLFRALGTLAMPEIDPWPFWFTYFTGAFINIAIGIFVITRFFGRDMRAGVIGGMSAAFANSVMVGVPVLNQAFGEPGLVIGFILVAVHMPIMMTVSTFLIEFAEHRDGLSRSKIDFAGAGKRIVRSLSKNPMVIAILCGVAFRATGLPMEGVPRTLIDRLSDTAIPLALMSLGMSLNKYGIRGNVKPAIALSVVKLLIMPAIVYVIAVPIMGLPPIAAAAAVITAACPTGVNAYLIATYFNTGLALSANTITITTAISVVTFTMWLAVFGH
ncbi:AEC family transporter [Acuticoccus sp. M5D2P5]|uniref:AEC family transporter n=1 Tax=Acuticoccus kalidii TaxID=2910977 RepID=UPI001F41FC22|nr:AEC family transporter [Acuticoccus kalidii]MCF3933626.1 AEC family transporter [Acuticoccus kalidii]